MDVSPSQSDGKETIVDKNMYNHEEAPSPSTSKLAGYDGSASQSVTDNGDIRVTAEATNTTTFAVEGNDFSCLSSDMAVPYVDAKTKAMGVRAELEELRRRSLTKKERSRVLKRLSLTDQADAMTQEISDFFLHQRDKERAFRQQQRDSLEFLHQYRGGEASLNAPGFAKENIYSKGSYCDLKCPSSMSELDPFSQRQMDLAREWKRQKQSALQNIRSFRSSYPLRATTAATQTIPAIQTSFSMEERESQGLSLQRRLETRHAEGSMDGGKEDRDVDVSSAPMVQSLRNSYEDRLEFLTRSPCNFSPYGRDSSDSSTPSSTLRKLSALTSPYESVASDCSSTASRKLAIIGSQDMERSDTHIFEDGDESVEEFDSVFRSASRANVVTLRPSESLSGISLPELQSDYDVTCLDRSPEAALLIIRAERLDSLETSLDALNLSDCGTQDDDFDPVAQTTSTFGDDDSDIEVKSTISKSERKSHIVPPRVRSSRQIASNDAGHDSGLNTSNESCAPAPKRNRTSGIVPPRRRFSKQSSGTSLIASEDESETEVLSASDNDSENPDLTEPLHEVSSSIDEVGSSTNCHQDPNSQERLKSNLVFPSVRSLKLTPTKVKASEQKPLVKRVTSLRNMFRRPARIPKSPPLRRVPLYERHPPDNKREVVHDCNLPFIPDLHKTRAGCERCLHWATPEEREKFEATGHHFRIMTARGGCDRNCTVFPRMPDEYPVRLCRKCFFDTHQFGKFYTV